MTKPGKDSKKQDRESTDESDLSGQQRDFFEEYFRKGAEFTRRLLAENDDLRRQLAHLESENYTAPFRDQHRGVTEHTAIERSQHELACLFVAQGQLARAREVSEVLGVMAEILLNFVGADQFVIYAADGRDVLRPLFAPELDFADLPLQTPKILGRAFATRSLVTNERTDEGSTEPNESNESSRKGSLEDGPSDEPLLAFPLLAGRVPFGAIGVWRLLQHKPSINELDRRLFDVVADAGGTALESARIRQGLPRLSGKVDYFSRLALLLGISSE